MLSAQYAQKLHFLTLSRSTTSIPGSVLVNFTSSYRARVYIICREQAPIRIHTDPSLSMYELLGYHSYSSLYEEVEKNINLWLTTYHSGKVKISRYSIFEGKYRVLFDIGLISRYRYQYIQGFSYGNPGFRIPGNRPGMGTRIVSGNEFRFPGFPSLLGKY